MKPPVKALIITLIVLIALPLLAWTGTFLYWHVRITRAIRTWEKNPKVNPTDVTTIYGPEGTASLMEAAGCRVLPHLVRAMDESKNPDFLEGITDRIAYCVGSEDYQAGTYPTSKEWAVASEQLFVDWKISEGDTPDVRRRKCAAIREWWSRNESRYHQWWRVWSGQCLR